jgi:SAM-dependent methyltransferase
VSAAARASGVIWQDVECGGYAADLGLWEELADEAEGSVLELGCGTGRVAIHLARHGHEVTGLDVDPDLVGAFAGRVGGLAVSAAIGDVREIEPGYGFAVILAPMQLIQLLADRTERISCLSGVADQLLPGGRAAFAIVEEVPPLPADGAVPQLPDVLEADGWVFSSLPFPPEVGIGSVVLRRLRQIVDPDGNLSEELNAVELQLLSAEALEREAAEVGLHPAGRREIPPTDTHVGSAVVLLEKVS